MVIKLILFRGRQIPDVQNSRCDLPSLVDRLCILYVTDDRDLLYRYYYIIVNTPLVHYILFVLEHRRVIIYFITQNYIR